MAADLLNVKGMLLASNLQLTSQLCQKKIEKLDLQSICRNLRSKQVAQGFRNLRESPGITLRFGPVPVALPKLRVQVEEQSWPGPMAQSEDPTTPVLFDSEGDRSVVAGSVDENVSTNLSQALTQQYISRGDAETEPVEAEDSARETQPEEVELLDSENQETETDHRPDTVDAADDHSEKLCQLPLSRIKAIMKVDPEFQMASKEAVVLIAKAAEKFVAYITEEAARITFQHKKKTLQPRDVLESIQSDPTLEFLDGAMEDVIAEMPPSK